MNRHWVWVCVMVMLFLGGCDSAIPKTIVAKPMPLLNSAWRAFSVRVAVDLKGAKHVVWRECPPLGEAGSCNIIYLRTYTGEVAAQFSLGAGTMPNVAATNDGRAVVVYLTETENRPMYAIIPAGATTAPTSYSLHPGVVISSEPNIEPVVESNGTYIYAVYNIDDGDNHISWRYRKILPTPVSETAPYVIEAEVTAGHDTNRVLVARVDNNNKLHTAWIYNYHKTPMPDDTFGVKYANNSGTSGNLTPITVYTTSTGIVGNVDLALEDQDTAHIAFSLPRTEDELWVAKVDLGVVTTNKINLPASDAPWDDIIVKIVYLTGVNHPQLVFTATNDDYAFIQIWDKNPTNSNAPIRVSTNLYHHSFLQVVPFDGVYLAGWRSYAFITSPRDVFCSYGGLPQTLVFNTTGGSTSYSQTRRTDMDASRNFAAGVWIDRRSNTADAPLVAWLGFNTHQLYVPFVRR